MKAFKEVKRVLGEWRRIQNLRIVRTYPNDLHTILQASKHLTNHVEELEQKILTVIESILQQHLSTWTASSASLPSANFRALCKQVSWLRTK